MMMDALRFDGYDIVFQEVPGEIALAINITGCPHKCPSCHSQFLWEYSGYYLLERLNELLEKYIGLITCVCFMGGDQNLEELRAALEIAKSHSLKTCVYSGVECADVFSDVLGYLDFLKIGPYIQERGGLSAPSTNQRFYRVDKSCLYDITKIFQKKHIQVEENI